MGQMADMARCNRFITRFKDIAKEKLSIKAKFIQAQGLFEIGCVVHYGVTIVDDDGCSHDLQDGCVVYDPNWPEDDAVEYVSGMFSISEQETKLMLEEVSLYERD